MISSYLPDGIRGQLDGPQPSYPKKDLGITFQDDLQFTKHLADKVNKANSMLGLIHRSFQYMGNDMLIHIYKALVHPHVEHASSVWSPFKLCDIKLIEGVQRRATRLPRDLQNEPYNSEEQELILLTTGCSAASNWQPGPHAVSTIVCSSWSPSCCRIQVFQGDRLYSSNISPIYT